MMPVHSDNFRRGHVAWATVFALVAVVRVLLSYSHTAQAFDEPYHIAAAIELLDRGTYTVDPLHPPLQRLAIGLPLYLAGARYPNLIPPRASALREPEASAAGNAILNDSGRYLRNLTLARLGVLPFLLLGCAVVFFWTRSEHGDFAALAAVALFTTLPIVLAFSGLAYTDIVAATTQAAACWAFARWLEKPGTRSAALMGLAAGLALLAKTTTYVFLPASFLGMVLLRQAVAPAIKTVNPPAAPTRTRHLAIAGIIAIVLLWAGYGFAVGHVREGMHLSADSIPSFQHFPPPLRKIGRDLILSDPRVPAPALLRGLAAAWIMEKSRPDAYLFGHAKPGGWWYFFLVGVAVKSPLPFLVLLGAGLFSFKRFFSERRWSAMAPAVCALAILLVTMAVKINYGVRHVLVVFPLLAMVAGVGCSYLWQLPDRQRFPGRIALVALLLWQCASTLYAGSDYIAYFNELAGKDPSTVMVAGCDLDCGQDLFILSRELQARHVSHVSLALWTSADITRMNLPEFDIPQPYQPVTGWFAISLRALRFGDLFHQTYPPDGFDWLSRYQPVARVGKTILLYDIPDAPAGSKSN